MINVKQKLDELDNLLFKSISVVQDILNCTVTDEDLLYVRDHYYQRMNNMKAPQIIYLNLVFLDALFYAYLHGKPKDEKYNIFGYLFWSTAMVLLLWWGGFFKF